jgi:hypothetical protein
MKKIHKIMSWVLLNINNIEKTLNRLIKKREDSNKIRNERRDIATNTTKMHRICYSLNVNEMFTTSSGFEHLVPSWGWGLVERNRTMRLCV